MSLKYIYKGKEVGTQKWKYNRTCASDVTEISYRPKVYIRYVKNTSLVSYLVRNDMFCDVESALALICRLMYSNQYVAWINSLINF